MAKHTVIEGEKFTVKYVPEGYMYISWLKDVEVNANDARAVMDAIVEASGGKRLPLMVDMTSMRKIDREARDVFSTTKKVSRVALVVGTALSRTVGSFFVGLGKPENPTRLFTDEGEASNWLLDNE